MGMAVASAGGKKNRATPQMNVTPLVDVVLVLLIIFMVVTPLLSKQFWLQIPQRDEKAAETPPSENKNVVLSVNEDGSVAINGGAIDRGELKDRMLRIMAARSDKVLYFDAADEAPYAATVEAMDIARQGGAKTIAVMTKNIVSP